MKMTYRIVYNPSIEDSTPATSKNIPFVCADGKIHLRLRDYDHEEVIHGFINKITYVVTYLFQRAVISGDSTNTLFEQFIKSDDSLNAFEMWLKSIYHSDGKILKGFKIFKNYRKIQVSHSTPLGSFLPGTCPLKDGLVYGDLKFLQDTLRFIPLEEFILNDAYDIVISKEVVKDSYTKFVNKSKKVKKDKLEYIPLF